ncbi:hypothetical protein CAEBREN_04890 [Caenorhabditis brenneri]|uniref:Uncharacterized protein n=1 Tax=Caenorhabditis brenneri TaxID=135651 RepID=G0NDS5_CAEBE|nr:hypothetical protein CAEBREN_04890 [Caenorhabditis brenneri]
MSGSRHSSFNPWGDDPRAGDPFGRRDNYYRGRQYAYHSRSPSPPRRHHQSPPRNNNSGIGPFEPQIRSDRRYSRSPSYDHQNPRNFRNPGRYSPDDMDYERPRYSFGYDNRYQSRGENGRQYDFSFRSPSPENEHRRGESEHRRRESVSPSPYRGLLEMLNRNPTAQDRQRHHQNNGDSHQDRHAVNGSRGRHEEREHHGYREENGRDRWGRSSSYRRSPPPNDYHFPSYRQQNGAYDNGAHFRPATPTRSRTSSWSDAPPRRQSSEPRASSPEPFEVIASDALQAPIFAPQDYRVNFQMENLTLEQQPVILKPAEVQIENKEQKTEIPSSQDSNQEENQENEENQAPAPSGANEKVPYHGLSFWFNPPGKRRRKPTRDSYLTKKKLRNYYFGTKVTRNEPEDSGELPTVPEELRQVLRQENMERMLRRRAQRNDEIWGRRRSPVWRSTTQHLQHHFDKVASRQTLENAGLGSSHDWYAESPPTSQPQSRPPSPTLHSTLNRKIYPKDYVCTDLQNVCIFCRGEHPADGCIEVMDVEERRKFLVERKRCLRCLGYLHNDNKGPCRKLEETCKYCLDKDSEELHHPALCREPAPLFGTRELPQGDDDYW